MRVIDAFSHAHGLDESIPALEPMTMGAVYVYHVA
jgi:hypothetical protein